MLVGMPVGIEEGSLDGPREPDGLLDGESLGGVTVGTPLGRMLGMLEVDGSIEGVVLGIIDTDGAELGCALGWVENEGFVLGPELG